MSHMLSESLTIGHEGVMTPFCHNTCSLKFTFRFRFQLTPHIFWIEMMTTRLSIKYIYIYIY